MANQMKASVFIYESLSPSSQQFRCFLVAAMCTPQGTETSFPPGRCHRECSCRDTYVVLTEVIQRDFPVLFLKTPIASLNPGISTYWHFGPGNSLFWGAVLGITGLHPLAASSNSFVPRSCDNWWCLQTRPNVPVFPGGWGQGARSSQLRATDLIYLEKAS